jgi:hypothetical protein
MFQWCNQHTSFSPVFESRLLWLLWLVQAMHVKNKSNTDPADFPNMLVVRPLPTDSATSAIGCTHLAGIKWVLWAIISMVVFASAATETGPSIMDDNLSTIAQSWTKICGSLGLKLRLISTFTSHSHDCLMLRWTLP